MSLAALESSRGAEAPPLHHIRRGSVIEGCRSAHGGYRRHESSIHASTEGGAVLLSHEPITTGGRRWHAPDPNRTTASDLAAGCPRGRRGRDNRAARPGWLTRGFVALGAAGSAVPDLVWSHSWAELDHALVAPRKVVLIPIEGRRLRFVTLGRRQLRPVLAALAEQAVRTERISRFSLAGFSV